MITASRGEAVSAKATGNGAEPTPRVPAPPPGAPSDRKPRVLCRAGAEPYDLPKEPLSRRSAPLAPELPEKLPRESASFIWINLWAAWCVPCKQEIPLLRSWEQKLSQGEPRLELRFVSLDDDDRQLDEFLSEQPASGIKTTYWLREGKERERWLRAAKLDPNTELPAHLVVDPTGKVRCTITGAVEAADFPQVERLIRGVL